MEKLSKHKESIIFVTCATALVGTLLLLQKATTPSQHKRSHAGSSVSRGVPRSRSASHGPVGARSRGSSRARGNHQNEKEGAALAAAISTYPVTSAAAGDHPRITAIATTNSRSRDASQPHPHRHHGHVRPSVYGGAAVAQESKKSLTVEAVAQHTKALGTASALHSFVPTVDFPGQTTGAQHRDVRTSGGSRTGGSGGCDRGVEDGVNCRSASNAATVGSQALYGASTTSPTAGSASLVAAGSQLSGAIRASHKSTKADGEDRTALSRRSLHTEVGVELDVVSSKNVFAPATTAAAAVKPATVSASETQTNVHWFCSDHGTQTEPMDAQGRYAISSATPDRFAQAAIVSPILPSGEGSDSTVLNCADFGWTPMREADCTQPMNTAGTGLCAYVQAAVVAPVPTYFLSRLEAQVRLLVRSICDDEDKEKLWLRLYVYLMELPLAVRKTLANRHRCGVTSAFISAAIKMSEEMMRHALTSADRNRERNDNGAAAKPVSDDGERLAAMEEATTSASSLPQEVLHLLQHGTAYDANAHFEWCDHHCVRVEGAFVARTSAPPCNAYDKTKQARSVRFSHVQLSPSSSASSEEASDSGDESPEDEQLSNVVAVAKHIERYSALLPSAKKVAAELPNTVDVEESLTGLMKLREDEQTPILNGRSNQMFGETSAVVQQLQTQRQRLTSFLSAFVQLKQSENLQVMQQVPKFAPFVCDFIELASSAQHFLDHSALSPDASHRVLQVPTTQKRIVPSEVTDIRDTSVGTTTSARSDSSPTSGAANRFRHGVKPRTPMKPSIRYPIQRVVSNSLSPAIGSPGAATGEAATVFERLYTPPQRT